MQNIAEQNLSGIKNSWTLTAFAKSHGRMKVTQPATYTNSKTGENFTARSCAFIHPTEKDEQGRQAVCFVGFARKLGELSPAEIVERQDELQVVQTNEDKYILCETGSGWDDVNLNL